jgi:hypothetical protein
VYVASAAAFATVGWPLLSAEQLAGASWLAAQPEHPHGTESMLRKYPLSAVQQVSRSFALHEDPAHAVAAAELSATELAGHEYVLHTAFAACFVTVNSALYMIAVPEPPPCPQRACASIEAAAVAVQVTVLEV